MKKSLISLIIIMIFIGIIPLFSNEVFAISPPITYDYSDTLNDINNWESDNSSAIEARTRGLAASIIDIVKIVGTGTSLLILLFMGVRYILKSPTEKAEFKKTFTAYIVGAIILFTATNLVAIVAEFATTNIQLDSAATTGTGTGAGAGSGTGSPP